ncbi:MAG TPA: HAMP domain-containing sensor histidine kinase [Myxococcales bacterium]|nr:HAMP domain-containing sensor histidine kinase [Myxococcales bacterium]
MGPLYAYSLVPVLSVAMLLFFTAALRGRNARGLAVYCLTVGVWTASLLCISLPSLAPLGERLAAIGCFTAAGFLHAAYDVTNQPRRSYRLVGLAYLVALAITLTGILSPGFLYGPLAMKRGPLFWPAMGLAVAAATVPLATLASAYRGAEPERRKLLRNLAAAGTLCYAGGMSNALLLSSGRALPFGMLGVLASQLVLANVVRAHQPPRDRRLLDRSLLYSALAALLSAGFLFGVMSLMTVQDQPLLPQYRAGALFLLFLAALAFEPLRQQVQEWLGRRLFRGRAGAGELAAALAEKEVRADQAGRLAELGQFTSAVAHEVRNPLGVLAAHLRALEKRGVDADAAQAMREQIERASHFVDELLRYGRPRQLELRVVDLDATVDLALSTARQGLGDAAPQDVEVVRQRAGDGALLEADQAQLTQVLVICVENALLALSGRPSPRLKISTAVERDRARLTIEDTGPGIPPELAGRLFQPFVTGRGRDGPRRGTGLGLAIARGIVERHGGSILAGRSESLGGARFEISLPKIQPVLGAISAGER